MVGYAMGCDNKQQTPPLFSHHKGGIRPSVKRGWHQKELPSYQTNIPGGIQVLHSRVWTHGPTPIMVAPQYHTTAPLDMQQASKTFSDNSHYPQLPWRASPNSFTRGHHAHSLGRQSHRRHLRPTAFPRKQGSCPQISYTPAEERQLDTWAIQGSRLGAPWSCPQIQNRQLQDMAIKADFWFLWNKSASRPLLRRDVPRWAMSQLRC